eukprot:4318173-Amphidinium_carterae.1
MALNLSSNELQAPAIDMCTKWTFSGHHAPTTAYSNNSTFANCPAHPLFSRLAALARQRRGCSRESRFGIAPVLRRAGQDRVGKSAATSKLVPGVASANF